jgi:putative Holliday junction resolvase
MRILAIDPGEKRMGIAVSDPTGTIANPLTVLKHVSRDEDTVNIIALAKEYSVDLIVIGQAFDEDGLPTEQGRNAANLADSIKDQSNILVELWDESGSTQAARSAQIALGTPRRKRRGHMDDLAATVILQSFIEYRLHRDTN